MVKINTAGAEAIRKTVTTRRADAETIRKMVKTKKRVQRLYGKLWT